MNDLKETLISKEYIIQKLYEKNAVEQLYDYIKTEIEIDMKLQEKILNEIPTIKSAHYIKLISEKVFSKGKMYIGLSVNIMDKVHELAPEIENNSLLEEIVCEELCKLNKCKVIEKGLFENYRLKTGKINKSSTSCKGKVYLSLENDFAENLFYFFYALFK